MPKEQSDWGLSDWLAFWESNSPVKFNLRLEAISAVAASLGVLNPQMPVITVAGTNGKGSTVAALTAIYAANGYSVGHFSSPHLIRFNERICINNQQIPDESAVDIFKIIYNTPGAKTLSYFEASLLCALCYFKSVNVDLIILEVGLGGRLDATNIIDADLSIITAIAFDHQEYLGTTLDAIGFEKAGIMRSGQPSVYASRDMPNSISEHAASIDCNLQQFGNDFTWNLDANSLTIEHFGHRNWQVACYNIQPSLLACSLVAVNLLAKRLPVRDFNTINACKTLTLPGRQQLLEINSRQILLDVAHNPHAVLALQQRLLALPVLGRVHAIFSGLADKDLAAMVTPLKPLVDCWYPTVLKTRRAASKNVIMDIFKESSSICYDDIFAAWSAVVSNYQVGDLVLVYGSFYLVGAVMEILGYEKSTVGTN